MKKKENQNIQHLTTCYMHRSKGSTISSSTKSQRQNKLRGNNCCSLKNNPGNVKYREFSAALETNLTAPARDSKNNKKKCTGGGGDITSTTTNLDRPTTSTTSSITTSSTTTPAEMNKLHQAKSFPMEVYKMLAVLEDLGLSRQICSWNPHGRSFQIHNNVKFVKFILPKFFRSIQMRTFKKQLSVYGFRRVLQNSEDYGSYYHERFLRGKPFLCSAIVTCTKERRRKMKTPASIHDDDVVEEPFFYALPYLPLLLPGHRYDSSIEVFGDDHNIETFFREVQEDHKRSCEEAIKMKHHMEEESRVLEVIPPESKARALPGGGGSVDGATYATEPIHHMATPATISSEQKEASFVKFCKELESILSSTDGNDANTTHASVTKKRQRNASPSPCYLRKVNKTVTRTRTKENHDLSVSSRGNTAAAVVVSPIPVEQHVQRHINDQFLWNNFNVVEFLQPQFIEE